AALGIGELFAVGFCGEDAEGYELRQALSKLPGVSLQEFFATSQRRTFTYCKPLMLRGGEAPRELNRVDFKNWTPTPAALGRKLARAVREVVEEVDAIIVLEQTDLAGTGVVTGEVVRALQRGARGSG